MSSAPESSKRKGKSEPPYSYPGVYVEELPSEMVKCWNCRNLITAYSGKVAKGKLFEKELRKCKVKSIVLGYHEVREERECSDFEQSKRWPKTREPPDFSKEGGIWLA